MTCRTCGNDRSVPGAKFCAICGARLAEEVSASKMFDQLPLYLKPKHVMLVLPFGRTKINAIMNDPSTGVIGSGRSKLWPKDSFIKYLESMDNIS